MINRNKVKSNFLREIVKQIPSRLLLLEGVENKETPLKIDRK